jgi:poly(glycerol-phosphate) alpha-glucosyltransferase
MKIGCLVDSISRDAGGLQTSVRRLMQLLHDDNNRLGVFSVMDRHTKEDANAWEPVPIHIEERVGPSLFGFSPFLGRAIHQFAPDVLNTHGLWTYTSIVSLRWRLQTQRDVIIHPHGMLDPWALKNSAWKKRMALAAFEHWHLRSASCIRALCQSEMDSIRALGLTNPVCVIPNGIDIPAAESTSASTPKGKRDHTLLYLGRIHPKKGLPELIRAWADLQKNPEAASWKLEIVGWDQGGHEQQLHSLASELGLPWMDGRATATADEVPLHFLGPRFGKEKDAVYAASDGFILPSLSEGLPMVVLEAWAHAKPAITTPACNLPEGYAAGAALKIQPDSESIYKTLLEFVQMPEDRRRRIGQQGLDLVKQRFTWKQIASQLSEVNDWLLREGDRPKHVYA